MLRKRTSEKNPLDLRVIVERFPPEKAILFGSHAYGHPTEHSDVDLLIVRRGIDSENESNLEIRKAFWSVKAPRPRLSDKGIFPNISNKK